MELRVFDNCLDMWDTVGMGMTMAQFEEKLGRDQQFGVAENQRSNVIHQTGSLIVNIHQQMITEKFLRNVKEKDWDFMMKKLDTAHLKFVNACFCKYYGVEVVSDGR